MTIIAPPQRGQFQEAGAGQRTGDLARERGIAVPSSSWRGTVKLLEKDADHPSATSPFSLCRGSRRPSPLATQ